MGAFSVNILGLSNKIHAFDYIIDAGFFKEHDTGIVSNGDLKAKVVLSKHETFIEALFDIEGQVELTCDRSLDLFMFPMKLNQKIIFKYGDEEKEVDEQVVMISHSKQRLDLGQYLFEFIGLNVPIKRLHPRYNETEEGDEIMYSTSASKEDEKEVDPRWEKLKRLK